MAEPTTRPYGDTMRPIEEPPPSRVKLDLTLDTGGVAKKGPVATRYEAEVSPDLLLKIALNKDFTLAVGAGVPFRSSGNLGVRGRLGLHYALIESLHLGLEGLVSNRVANFANDEMPLADGKTLVIGNELDLSGRLVVGYQFSNLFSLSAYAGYGTANLDGKIDGTVSPAYHNPTGTFGLTFGFNFFASKETPVKADAVEDNIPNSSWKVERLLGETAKIKTWWGKLSDRVSAAFKGLRPSVVADDHLIEQTRELLDQLREFERRADALYKAIVDTHYSNFADHGTGANGDANRKRALVPVGESRDEARLTMADLYKKYFVQLKMNWYAAIKPQTEALAKAQGKINSDEAVVLIDLPPKIWKYEALFYNFYTDVEAEKPEVFGGADETKPGEAKQSFLREVDVLRVQVKERKVNLKAVLAGLNGETVVAEGQAAGVKKTVDESDPTILVFPAHVKVPEDPKDIILKQLFADGRVVKLTTVNLHTTKTKKFLTELPPVGKGGDDIVVYDKTNGNKRIYQKHRDDKSPAAEAKPETRHEAAAEAPERPAPRHEPQPEFKPAPVTVHEQAPEPAVVDSGRVVPKPKEATTYPTNKLRVATFKGEPCSRITWDDRNVDMPEEGYQGYAYKLDDKANRVGDPKEIKISVTDDSKHKGRMIVKAYGFRVNPGESMEIGFNVVDNDKSGKIFRWVQVIKVEK